MSISFRWEATPSKGTRKVNVRASRIATPFRLSADRWRLAWYHPAAMTRFLGLLVFALALVVGVVLWAQDSPPPLTPPQAPSGPTPMPSVLRGYTAVTEARLRNPNDGDWMMNRRTYSGWGYSPLTQITA